MNGSEPQVVTPLNVLNADRAAWLKERLRYFLEFAKGLDWQRAHMTRADAEMFELALEGAIRGQAREIARTLGFEPGVNLELSYRGCGYEGCLRQAYYSPKYLCNLCDAHRQRVEDGGTGGQ